MKTENVVTKHGSETRIKEYLVFDDLQEYLDWYVKKFNNEIGREEGDNKVYPFTRVGYENWVSTYINGSYYYSLYREDHEKVTPKLYKKLLEYADKKYRAHVYNQKYMGKHGNSRVTDRYDTKEEAIEESKELAQESIDYYQEKINELQKKIDYLKNLNHEEILTTEYKITYPKEDGSE